MTTIIYMPEGHNLESFLCTLAQGEASLAQNFLVGAPLGMSNGIHTASECSKLVSETDSLTIPLSLETLESSTKEVMRKPTLDTLMSSARASLNFANHSALPEINWRNEMIGICGQRQLKLLELFGPDPYSSKTFPVLSHLDTLSRSLTSCGNLAIKCYPLSDCQLVTLEPVTRGKESGLLPTPTVTTGAQVAWDKTPGQTGGTSLAGYVNQFPTPTVDDAKNVTRKSGQYQSLTRAVLWPTPPTRDWKDGTAKSCANVPTNGLLGRKIHEYADEVAVVVGGKLNPDWVELLMGWPRCWTALDELKEVDWNSFWEGNWEGDVPRVASSVDDRVSRLKALGNGQVPAVAATAWKLLTGDVK